MTATLPTILALFAVLVGGCAAVGPDYQRPAFIAPGMYKEQKDWKPSQPRSRFSTDPWWKVYHDPELDALEARVDISNQTLKAGAAAYLEAAAIVDQARAGYAPTVTGSASAMRDGHGPHQVDNQYGVGATATWTLDIWGKVRRIVESDVADAQASAADLATARLSMQAMLANDYLSLRSDDELKRLLDTTAVNYGRSLKITMNQHAFGINSEADVVQAQTQYQSIASQALNIGVQRGQLEHAIAVLVGAIPSEFSIPVTDDVLPIPDVPVDVPSTLLERRPDIAAAERRMASANARIGIAIAAWYPDLSLSASFGFQSMGDTLLRAADEVWAVGPALAGTLSDGGLRSAQSAAARAAYLVEVADYRQTVLTAFQQVEDALITLRILQQQTLVQDDVVASSQKAVQLILNQYQAGIVAYTNVITAQTIALNNQQVALSIHTNLLNASVNLIVALGGGWDASMLPAADRVSRSSSSAATSPPIATQN